MKTRKPYRSILEHWPEQPFYKAVSELTHCFLDNWDVQNRPTIKLDNKISHSHESNLLHLSIDKIQTKLNWKPTYNFLQ